MKDLTILVRKGKIFTYSSYLAQGDLLTPIFLSKTQHFYLYFIKYKIDRFI